MFRQATDLPLTGLECLQFSFPKTQALAVSEKLLACHLFCILLVARTTWLSLIFTSGMQVLQDPKLIRIFMSKADGLQTKSEGLEFLAQLMAALTEQVPGNSTPRRSSSTSICLGSPNQ